MGAQSIEEKRTHGYLKTEKKLVLIIMKVIIQTSARSLLHKLDINEIWGLHTIILMREHGCDFHLKIRGAPSN